MYVCDVFQIRKDYYEDRVSAGPQSRVLEGMTWEEAKKLQVRYHYIHQSAKF